MKHLLTPFLLLFACGLHAQQYIEDFDSYNVGDGIAETVETFGSSGKAINPLEKMPSFQMNKHCQATSP